MLFAACAAAFAACSKDQTETVTPDTPTVTFRFSADTDPETDQSAMNATTRTEFDENYQLKWCSSDEIGLFIASADPTNNAEAIPDLTISPTVFEASVNPYSVGDKVYAYYPYDPAQTSTTVALTVPAAQESPALDKFNGAYNPLVAIPTETTDSDTEYAMIEQLCFRQTAAMAAFNIYTSTEEYVDETIESISYTNTGSDAPIAGTFSVDLTAVPSRGDMPAIESIENGSKTIEVNFTGKGYLLDVNDKETNIVYMSVLPGEYEGTVVVTTNKATYTFPAKKPLPLPRAYVRKIALDLAKATERKPNQSGAEINTINIASIENAGITLNSGTYIKQETSWNQNGIEYSANYIAKNTKDGTGNILMGANQFLQFQKNTGYIQNITEQSIKQIVVYVHPQKDGFTLETGTDKNTLASANPLKETTTANVTDNNGNAKDIELNVYTYTAVGNINIFKIAATATLWIYKIDIEYGQPAPAIILSEATELTIPSTDLEEHTFVGKITNSENDATLAQDTESKDWLSVSKSEKDAANSFTVTYSAKSENTTGADRKAYITLAIADGTPVEVTITQKKGATALTMSEVSASATATSVTLNWDKVNGATSYGYALQQADTQIAAGTTENLTITIPDLTASTTYTYSVWAIGDDLEWANSQPVTAAINTSDPANEATIIFDLTTTAMSAANGQNPMKGADAYIYDNTAAKNIGLVFGLGKGTTDPYYYKSTSSNTQLNANNTLTIEGRTMKQIKFKTQSASGTLTASEGTYSDWIWTGSANKIVFTAASGYIRLTEIEVTYDPTTPAEFTPVILSISPEPIGFEATGGEQTFSVSAMNTDGYTLTASGLSAPLSAKVEGMTVTVSAAQNTGDAISQQLILTLGSSKLEIPIKQAGGNGGGDTGQIFIEKFSTIPDVGTTTGYGALAESMGDVCKWTGTNVSTKMNGANATISTSTSKIVVQASSGILTSEILQGGIKTIRFDCNGNKANTVIKLTVLYGENFTQKVELTQTVKTKGTAVLMTDETAFDLAQYAITGEYKLQFTSATGYGAITNVVWTN